MERVIRTGADERPIDDHELMDMRIKLDEGRFFFPPKPVALFEMIDQLTTQHEVARLSWLTAVSSAAFMRATNSGLKCEGETLVTTGLSWRRFQPCGLQPSHTFTLLADPMQLLQMGRYNSSLRG